MTIFDIQVLYLPSYNFLEAIEYNEISKEETEKRYSLLKRTDLQLDFSKVKIQSSNSDKQDETLIKVGLSIANIDFKMTTKEVKDIKGFTDKFLKYHKDLDDQVKEELIKIKLEAQFRQSSSLNRN